MKELARKYCAEITDTNSDNSDNSGSLTKRFDIDEYLDYTEQDENGSWHDTITTNKKRFMCSEAYWIESTVTFENSKPISATYCFSRGDSSGDEIEDCINGVMDLWEKNIVDGSERIDLISPTHGEKYKIKDVLMKGLDRASIDWVSFELKPVHTCEYGSTDYELAVECLECSESQWGESVTFRINGVIPVHTTKDGKISIEYGCGCDSGWCGGEETAPWDKYKEKELGSLFSWIPGDNIVMVETPMEKVIEDGECREILLSIIKDMISRDFFLGKN